MLRTCCLMFARMKKLLHLLVLGALLAMRRFISDASFEEARRNLDSNQSVIRTAAISKFENCRYQRHMMI